MDAPRHLLPDGLTIDQLPLEIWGGEAVVVDVSHIGPREGITAMVLMEVGAKIHPGDIVLLRTSWDQRYNIASREFWTESPYLSEDGAEWLRSRGIRALGSDFPTDDALKADLANPSRQRHASDYVSHHVLLAMVSILSNT
jgi:kynurenine formamidase